MRAPRQCRRSTTATRPAAAPCIMARCHGACTKTISVSAPRPSSATAKTPSPLNLSLTDWPVSYAELEPFYDQAEYELGVSGKAGNLQGAKIDGGNVFEDHEPRISVAGAAMDRSAGCCSRRGAQAGLASVLVAARDPVAALSEPAGCTYCGFARPSAASSAPSRASSSPSCRRPMHRQLQAAHRRMCYRVNSDNSGRHGRVLSMAGRFRQHHRGGYHHCRAFIYDNTRLMLLSKTEKFPMASPIRAVISASMSWRISGAVFAKFDDRHVNNYMGPSAQKHTVDDYNADNFDHGGLGFIRGAQISSALESRRRPDRRGSTSQRRRASDDGELRIATSSPIFHAARGDGGADRKPALCPIRRSISIRMSAISGVYRRLA